MNLLEYWHSVLYFGFCEIKAVVTTFYSAVAVEILTSDRHERLG